MAPAESLIIDYHTLFYKIADFPTQGWTQHDTILTCNQTIKTLREEHDKAIKSYQDEVALLDELISIRQNRKTAG